MTPPCASGRRSTAVAIPYHTARHRAHATSRIFSSPTTTARKQLHETKGLPLMFWLSTKIKRRAPRLTAPSRLEIQDGHQGLASLTMPGARFPGIARCHPHRGPAFSPHLHPSANALALIVAGCARLPSALCPLAYLPLASCPSLHPPQAISPGSTSRLLAILRAVDICGRRPFSSAAIVDRARSASSASSSCVMSSASRDCPAGFASASALPPRRRARRPPRRIAPPPHLSCALRLSTAARPGLVLLQPAPRRCLVRHPPVPPPPLAAARSSPSLDSLRAARPAAASPCTQPPYQAPALTSAPSLSPRSPSLCPMPYALCRRPHARMPVSPPINTS